MKPIIDLLTSRCIIRNSEQIKQIVDAVIRNELTEQMLPNNPVITFIWTGRLAFCKSTLDAEVLERGYPYMIVVSPKIRWRTQQ